MIWSEEIEFNKRIVYDIDTSKITEDASKTIEALKKIEEAMQEIQEGKGIPMEDIVTEMEEKYHLSEDL